MKNTLWKLAAWICTRGAVRRWILQTAFRTPYGPIMARRDPTQIYMDRWWLFNPYGKDAEGNPTPARWPWLPSVRVHHIVLSDDDQHMHDHPWDARTIILSGGYMEERGILKTHAPSSPEILAINAFDLRGTPFYRLMGDTCALKVGDYHRIVHVASGTYTLFFTFGPYMNWGFDVDGKHVPWREYLGMGK